MPCNCASNVKHDISGLQSTSLHSTTRAWAGLSRTMRTRNAMSSTQTPAYAGTSQRSPANADLAPQAACTPPFSA